VKRTHQPKQKDIKRNWHLVDANGQILGRMATGIARLLIGKHKPDYVSHLDMGDNVVVINASQVKLSGKKEKQKVYYRHSGYPGGLKIIKYERMKSEHPERIVELAVKGMLPSNRLTDKRMRRLMVFKGDTHPYKKKFENAKEN